MEITPQLVEECLECIGQAAREAPAGGRGGYRLEDLRTLEQELEDCLASARREAEADRKFRLCRVAVEQTADLPTTIEPDREILRIEEVSAFRMPLENHLFLCHDHVRCRRESRWLSLVARSGASRAAGCG